MTDIPKRPLRSEQWFNDPAHADMTALYVERYMNYGMTREELHAAKTDGHMDTNSIREGCVLICPVKVPGAGVYMGDMHAQQGNGEIAGHATDCSGETEVQVQVIKALSLEGPIILQNLDDLPPMARPMTAEQRRHVRELGARWGQTEIEQSGPITFIDQTGLKAFVAKADDYAARYGDRFKVPQLLRDMAAKNETFYGKFAPEKVAA